jgi:branched-subunit amino acid aminotransferase/4-amino-4-deoxychorismate lyase
MTAIAWIDTGPGSGRWGAPEQLGLPADARGLLLGEGVFETVLVLDARPRLLPAHLQRWQQGAGLLGLAAPPTDGIDALITEAIERSGISTGALRLNWCRGSAPRGLQVAAASHADGEAARHLFWLQLSACAPAFAAVQVIISPTEVRSATSVLSRCKSFGYGSSLVARRQAAAAGAGDALLLSSTGELCCGSSANLLVRRDDRWLTPPLASGCLGGIMRQRALTLKLAQEARLEPGDLASSSAALLLNSLGCRPITPLSFEANQASRPPALSCEQAERFWRRLLEP